MLTPILKCAKHVILLTGTPALAKPKELFTLLSILRPNVFNFFKHFGVRYCDPKPSIFVLFFKKIIFHIKSEFFIIIIIIYIQVSSN